MELYLVVIALIVLVVAVILLMKRPQGAVVTRELTELRKEKETLTIALARAQQQGESLLAEKERITAMLREEQQRLLSELQASREQLAQADKSLENLRAYHQSQREKLDEQRAEIETIKRQFNTEFQVIANQILEEKTQKFTEANSKSLDLILNPLKEKIKTFEEKVEKTYQHEAAERNSLKGVVQQLMEQSLRIKDEANSLTRALRGDSKKQGNWGEVILERVLERSGLVRDREYRLQASLLDDEGKRLQPDAIIDLPDEKHLVVDAKVSLIAYERWVNADTDEERELAARQHIQSVENHVKGLSAKNYHDLYQINSPDFVLLFMPIESAFSMSITYKADLFSDAWDRKVVIVSPSTLLATLRTIASMWKHERQTRNVLEIAKEAGALYDKFVGFLQDMDKIGEQLNRAVRAHEDATKKLGTGPGNVIKKVEKLKKLGARANKQIDGDLLDDGN
ncbi:DNA recombination protein RmuC [Parapedobacter pyrenivorans]|uniref:DNA recombination protein RmuC n=1 Tax=Parapedobacter pyrenivorans TaxID=1305674 RepID=A0A917M6C5_9SPHI|nr:DNA recombination protein RmuC [Parapedobacter pyrenivorans]GGG80243.1 DNA recombination protein RmuC [Parapedobacter pyrenivorans]